MKISLSWLQNHIELKNSFEDIADKLTFSGLEVEHFYEKSSIPGGLKGIVVGEVLECAPVPETDKLKLTKVSIGEDSEELQIVCGAPNVKKGIKVAVATVGTTIHPIKDEPFTIRKAKIRGVHSFGMLCAEDEIGIGTGHEGIMILPNDSKPGSLLSDLYNIENETVIDIGLTANRGDATSHRGVARDISALENIALKPLDNTIEYGKSPSSISLEVLHEDCPRYMGVQIDDVTISDSPEWLQNALKSIDIEPINNIVDITNYVLHDLGQPIHAFDISKITGNKVIVRKAKEEEKLITLDDKERELKNTDLIIANSENPMALAGVFGGANSGISNETKSIFIESAYFNPVTVRKTAKSFALNTDASYRYERGTDPNMVEEALNMVAKLVKDIAGGSTIYQPIEHYPHKIEHFEINLTFRNINRILGIDIPKERVINILKSLEIEILEEKPEGLKLSVPPFKSDVTREIDVIEEIIRIYGFNNIPLKNNTSLFNTNFKESGLFKSQIKIKRLLQGLGFSEIMTNSMVGVSEDNSVQILNPLSRDTASMRTSLELGMLHSIAHNVNRKNEQLKFYEMGTIFTSSNGAKINEEQQLVIGCFGTVFNEGWQFNKVKTDEFYLKNIIEELLASFGIPASKMNRYITKEPYLVDMKRYKQIKIKGKVFLTLINLSKILQYQSKPLKVQDIVPYPKVRRDLSLVINKNIQYSEIKKIATQIGGHLLKDMNVFDVFEGKPLEENKKSYSVSYIWQSDKETLQDDEVDQKMNKLMESYSTQIGALIRK